MAELARQVHQGDGAKDPAQAARDQGIDLRVIKLDEAKKGFLLLPRRLEQLRVA